MCGNAGKQALQPHLGREDGRAGEGGSNRSAEKGGAVILVLGGGGSNRSAEKRQTCFEGGMLQGT